MVALDVDDWTFAASHVGAVAIGCTLGAWLSMTIERTRRRTWALAALPALSAIVLDVALWQRFELSWLAFTLRMIGGAVAGLRIGSLIRSSASRPSSIHAIAMSILIVMLAAGVFAHGLGNMVLAVGILAFDAMSLLVPLLGAFVADGIRSVRGAAFVTTLVTLGYTLALRHPTRASLDVQWAVPAPAGSWLAVSAYQSWAGHGVHLLFDADSGTFRRVGSMHFVYDIMEGPWPEFSADGRIANWTDDDGHSHVVEVASRSIERGPSIECRRGSPPRLGGAGIAVAPSEDVLSELQCLIDSPLPDSVASRVFFRNDARGDGTLVEVDWKTGRVRQILP
jgi:hypothetical protein